MSEEKSVGLDKCIIDNFYSGFHERVYYSGMSSPEAFVVTYETFFVRDNPECKAVSHHNPNSRILDVQERRQVFFPVGTKEIEFPSRTSCKFQVKSVSPTELTVVVDERQCYYN